MPQKITQQEFHLKKEKELHKIDNPLRDVILGGQDGLVNALGIILGFSAVSSDIKILIATVIAATIAESLSMGAVAYTSAMSQKDFYESERAKERKEIEERPELEKEELRLIYERKGFSGKVLSEIIETITKNPKIWLDTMMSEELRIDPVITRRVLISAVIVTIATAIGHIIPLVPFFFMPHSQGIIVSTIISAITLFIVGAYQAHSLVGNPLKTGIKLTLIGMGAAGAGFIIAKIFHAAS